MLIFDVLLVAEVGITFGQFHQIMNELCPFVEFGIFPTLNRLAQNPNFWYTISIRCADLSDGNCVKLHSLLTELSVLKHYGRSVSQEP